MIHRPCYIWIWLLVITITSCVTQEVSSLTNKPVIPAERASVAAQELTSEYLAYYNMVSNALEFGSSEDVYWLQSNMTKTIDETAGELQVFNNYVIAWRTTGLMPKRIISQEIKVRQLLGEIEKLWTQY